MAEKASPLIPKLLKIFIVSKVGVEQQEYAPNGEITKRQCDKNPTGIVLTQRGYKIDIPHRIPGITNLEGTIVHELGHFIQKYFPGFEAQWYEALNYQSLVFDGEQSNPPGWVKVKEEDREVFKHIETKIKSYSGIVPQDPEKLPTSYAGFYPVEDIAESFVCWLFDKPLAPKRKELFDDFFTKKINESHYDNSF